MLRNVCSKKWLVWNVIQVQTKKSEDKKKKNETFFVNVYMWHHIWHYTWLLQVPFRCNNFSYVVCGNCFQFFSPKILGIKFLSYRATINSPDELFLVSLSSQSQNSYFGRAFKLTEKKILIQNCGQQRYNVKIHLWDKLSYWSLFFLRSFSSSLWSRCQETLCLSTSLTSAAWPTNRRVKCK